MGVECSGGRPSGRRDTGSNGGNGLLNPILANAVDVASEIPGAAK
jgi:hypothetical protein